MCRLVYKAKIEKDGVRPMAKFLSDQLLSKRGLPKKGDKVTDIITSRFTELLESARMTYARLDQLEHRTREQVRRDEDPLWEANFAKDYYDLKERAIQLSNRIRVHRNYIEELERKQELNADAFDEAYRYWLDAKCEREGVDVDYSDDKHYIEFLTDGGYESPGDGPTQDQIIEEYAALAQFENNLDELETRLDQMESDYQSASRKLMSDYSDEIERLTAQLKQNMAKLNYSATDLAKLLDISPAKLGKMLRGEQAFPEDIIKHLSIISPRLAEDITDGFVGPDKWMVNAEGMVSRLVTIESQAEQPDDPSPYYCSTCKKTTDSKVIASSKGKVKGAAATVSIRDRKRQCLVCGNEIDTCEVSADRLNQQMDQLDRHEQISDQFLSMFKSVRSTIKVGGPDAELIGPLLTRMALDDLPEAESLENIFPEIAQMYEPLANEKPANKLWPHSNEVCYWQDTRCGHAWHASPAFMINPSLGGQCPICAGVEGGNELNEFGEGEWPRPDTSFERQVMDQFETPGKKVGPGAGNVETMKAKQPNGPELVKSGREVAKKATTNLETATELLKTSEAELEAELARFKRLHDKGLITEAVLEEKQKALIA